jgi:hypothetical protein
MGGFATVTNKGSKTYTEVFKERPISLKPGESIKLPRHEAQEFLGTMSAKLPNGGWEEKNLSIQILPEKEPEPSGFICQVDGQVFKDKESLNEHLKVHKAQLLKEK